MSAAQPSPWASRTLADLPPEVILKALSGLSVQDVVTIAQVCTATTTGTAAQLDLSDT